MITIEQALQQIDEVVSVSSKITLPLTQSTGRTLAEPIYAPIDLPPFRQSAMDGYALNFNPDFDHYLIAGEIAAGDATTFTLEPGQCVRIFTGARVPDSANMVIMQEDIRIENGFIILENHVKEGSHIRKQGEQIKKNEPVYPAGRKLTPACIGFLCSLGVTEVMSYRKPSITIIATGSELVKPGQPLPQGKIYESNSYMLQSAVDYYKLADSKIIWVKDDLKEISEIIHSAIHQSDFILLSGGVSAGDYDFVSQALEMNGVKCIFHKVKQKPGKPLYFGKCETGTYVFGLPGNPAAAMTSFLVYVIPALRKFSGEGFTGLQKVQIPLENAYVKNDDKGYFLKASIKNHKAKILQGQNSDMMFSFSESDALMYIPEDVHQMEADDLVELYLI